MKRSERFALSTYLTSFPEMASFDEIMNKIKENSGDIEVWYPFQNYTPTELTEFITNTFCEIEREFLSCHDLITVIDKETVKRLFFNAVGRQPLKEELSRLCTLLDNDFSYQLPYKILDALKVLHILTDK